MVERSETPVMFKRVADEVTAIGRGMQEVEEAVGLRGRKYYGAFNNDGEYRICVQLREGDDPHALGLEVGSLPGGRYVRERLIGEPPKIYELIGPTFERLSAAVIVIRHVRASSSTDAGTSSTCCCPSPESHVLPTTGCAVGCPSVQECSPEIAL